MEKQALFFDLDGTLVDTMPDIIAAVENALKRCGYPVHPAEAYPAFVGSGLREAGRRAMPSELREDEEQVDELYRAIVEAYRLDPFSRTRAYPGIPDLLERLHGRGYRLAIVTNKDRDIARQVVDARLPHQLFEELIGVDEDTPPKPDPAGCLGALKRMGLQREAALFVGDSDVDTWTAQACGFTHIAVSWGYRERSVLEASGARLIADSPDMIEQCMEEEDGE